MIDKNVSVLTSGSYTGSQTVREFEVTDLKVEDGKLNGTAVGSVEKEGTGVVDKVRLSFTDVPFEGVGGSGGINVTKVALGTWNGSVAAISSGYFIGGCGGAFLQAPVSKILRGRTVIDYIVYASETSQYEPAICGRVYGTIGSISRDLRELTPEELDTCGGGSWYGLFTSRAASDQCTKFDIYALVIGEPQDETGD